MNVEAGNASIAFAKAGVAGVTGGACGVVDPLATFSISRMTTIAKMRVMKAHVTRAIGTRRGATAATGCSPAPDSGISLLMSVRIGFDFGFSSRDRRWPACLSRSGKRLHEHPEGMPGRRLPNLLLQAVLLLRSCVESAPDAIE